MAYAGDITDVLLVLLTATAPTGFMDCGCGGREGQWKGRIAWNHGQRYESLPALHSFHASSFSFSQDSRHSTQEVPFARIWLAWAGMVLSRIFTTCTHYASAISLEEIMEISLEKHASGL